MYLSASQRPEDHELQRLFPAGVSWHLAGPGAPGSQLIGGEISAAAAMSPQRLAAFQLGRHCARVALAHHGLVNVELPVGKERAPMWPTGFVGSISHTREMALAAAGPADIVVGLGVDIEETGALDAPLIKLICRPEEIRRLDEIGPPEIAARLLFSAKESVYKCVWPLLRRYVDFLDVGLDIDVDRRAFRIEKACRLIEPYCDRIIGRLSWTPNLIMTSAHVDGPA